MLEKGIYIEFRPATSSSGLEVPTGDLHSYLVFRDGDGNARVIRGGPRGGLKFMVGGPIEVQVDKPLQQSEDKYGRGETPESRHARKLDLGGQKPEEVWKGMSKRANEIGEAKLDYDLVGKDQNSNSVTRALLKTADIPVEKVIPPGVDKGKLPGFENDLSDPSSGASREEDKAPKPENGREPDAGDGIPTLAAAPSGDESLKGGAGKDTLDASSPDAERFMRELMKPDGSVAEIMLKPAETLTADEVRAVMGERIQTPTSNPEHAEMVEKERGFFRHFFGDGPIKRDATGRMIEPTPRIAIPHDPAPATAAGGEPLSDALKAIGERVAKGAGRDGIGQRVRDLQTGLNLLRDGTRGATRDGRESRARRLPALRVDGVSGPRTRGALKRILATRGRARTEEGLALGGFRNFAERARRSGRTAGLGATTEETFATLFRDPAKPTRGPRVEARTLQETLNDLDSGPSGASNFTPLRTDAVIGRKTEVAFARVTRAQGADALTRRFGEFLGFL